ncbi:hypothetical protein sscle_03g025400 [Sclerotinia sclerotiorum 1980 UF-70]|uniref:Uncharacterized protein n=1 Tax=Sclerotinia sclerotiorum (strain ATCC 18683 / 1980 / Ss-1) TaxID=665079 RepID=A0A1D9PYJ4_SCLS1|nr:hypothetical protein sscle_03g025400 [Sclerotinia sclerotiorum 1980 UF-70]
MTYRKIVYMTGLNLTPSWFVKTGDKRKDCTRKIEATVRVIEADEGVKEVVSEANSSY